MRITVESWQRLESAESSLKRAQEENQAELAKHAMREELLDRDLTDWRSHSDLELVAVRQKYEEASCKVEVLKGEIRQLQAAEKEKDAQVEEAWRRMSEFERMVRDLKMSEMDVSGIHPGSFDPEETVTP